MKLTGKVILIIVSTVTFITTLIFYLLLLRFDRQLEQNLLKNARAVYKNILIIRQWVSDYNGIYVFKKKGVNPNPYLTKPLLLTRTGDTLLLKNPALVTRELSELSRSMGADFHFHMASRNYINPVNKPDGFEKTALVFFEDSTRFGQNREFYRQEELDGHRYFRYFAPLFIEESCLTCHSKQGYQLSDLRGGVSIILTVDDIKVAKRDNLIFFFLSALVTIGILSVLIFIAFRRIVIRPLRQIETATQSIQEGFYDFRLRIKNNDEIGRLAEAFEQMKNRIQNYLTQLKNSERKYRNLIENSLEAVAIIRPDGEILECNSKLTHLTGFDSEELKQRNFYVLFSSDDSRKKIEDPDQPFETIQQENKLYSKDGLEIPVEIYMIKGFSFDGLDNLSFVYVRDLSERKKIEQYSIQTEKIVALGQMSSGIAHEIRNPLFSISNNIDYLKVKFGERIEFLEIYPELQDGIDRIQKLVSAILDFTRPHQPEFNKYDIEQIINKCILLIKKQFEKSSIEIKTEFAANPQPVEVDSHQVEQVFINLFMNSFYAMGNTGILTISTEYDRSVVQVRIEDTGKGIPEDEIDRIFDPFYSKTPNGTGLGLAIVQRILNQHQAEYQVHSSPYLGTKFFINFPYTRRK